MFKILNSNQRGIAQILILIILLAGIIAGVYLVQRTQIFKPKAYSGPIVTVTDASGIPLPERISDPNVYLVIRLPEGWKPTNESSNSFVKLVYAQPACRTETTVCGQPSYQDCKFTCTNGRAMYKCVQSDNPNCQGEIYCAPEDSECAMPTPPPKPTPTPISPAPSPTPVSPTSKPTPSLRILRGLYIENKDTDGSIGGHKPFHLTSNFSDYLNKPVYWKLNDLLSNQNEAVRVVQVTFFDGTNYVPFVATVTLVRPQRSNEFLVDVIIHESLTNQQEVESWGRDAINNYFNARLNEAGVSKRIRLDKVTTGYKGKIGCGQSSIYGPDDPEICKNIRDGKIRVWLYQKGEGDRQDSGRADPSTAQVFVSIPTYSIPEIPRIPEIENAIGFNIPTLTQKELDRRVLTHELGHVFGIPDYYLENVLPSFNKVEPTIAIAPSSWDVMWISPIFNHFSNISKAYIESVRELPIENISSYLEYVPKQVVLRLEDRDGLPLSDAKIEIFSQQGGDIGIAIERRCGGIIPDTIFYDGVTSGNGEFEIGNNSGRTLLIRITYQEGIRYTAISNSYLNKLYFQGEKDKAVITLPFHSLVEKQEDRLWIIKEPTTIIPLPRMFDEEREALEKYFCLSHPSFETSSDLSRILESSR